MHNMYKLYIPYIFPKRAIIISIPKKKHRQPPPPPACLERSAASSRSDWKLNLSEICPWWENPPLGKTLQFVGHQGIPI